VLKHSRIAFVVVWVLLSVAVSKAQGDQPCAERKIAFYDQYVIEAANGVRRLHKAVEVAIDPGYVPTQSAQAREESYKKRRRLLVDPLLKEINDSIERIANHNKILLWETSALDSTSSILVLIPGFDITDRLVPILNKDQSETTDITIRKSRVAFVDSRKFFDVDGGLIGFRLLSEDQLKDLCKTTKKCADVSKRLEEYARQNNISVIIDLSKPRPEKVDALICKEETTAFIAYYNQSLSS
jgi:hypothetical protein